MIKLRQYSKVFYQTLHFLSRVELELLQWLLLLESLVSVLIFPLSQSTTETNVALSKWLGLVIFGLISTEAFLAEERFTMIIIVKEITVSTATAGISM